MDMSDTERIRRWRESDHLTTALWIFVGIGIGGAAFMVWFLFALQADIRRGTRLEAVPEEQESPHYEFEIADPAAVIEKPPFDRGGKLVDFPDRSRITGSLMGVALLVMLAPRANAQNADAPAPTTSEWQFGGTLDGAYIKDFNNPANGFFRSRGTAYKVDDPILNMAMAYVRKAPTETSRWGMEFTAQSGQDTRVFGFSATAPNLPGSQGLRHLGPTDVSYLAPIGKGLTIQGGIFSSLIGYDSLYAKDNLNYTRPWGADFTPYLMLGINASYPFTNKLTVTGFVVNGYWHLGNANGVPSVGAQLAYKATSRWNLKETAMYGPHQSDTSLEFWRFLSDSIVEYKTDRTTVAFEYHVGTETVATAGNAHAVWMASQLPLHFALNKRWSVTERPEVYWDNTGRITGAAQTVKANTATLEYKVPYRKAAAIFRLEHRVDDSRGPQGGFFTDRFTSPGVIALKPTQHLLAFAVILTFDSTFRH